MKKLVVFLVTLSLLSLPVIGAAQFVGPIAPSEPCPDCPRSNISTIEDILGVMNRIVNWFFALVLILAVIFLLWAAIRFFTAGGDEEAIASARWAVAWALVGIAIALLAKGLILLIANLVETTSLPF
ncbi:MAG: hypothetical protein HY460_02415 [Parcubacteria group bacterium]|nr:hypothetical protein [Parcubacteria group bacterium]